MRVTCLNPLVHLNVPLDCNAVALRDRKVGISGHWVSNCVAYIIYINLLTSHENELSILLAIVRIAVGYSAFGIALQQPHPCHDRSNYICVWRLPLLVEPQEEEGEEHEDGSKYDPPEGVLRRIGL